MNEFIEWHHNITGEKVAKALIENGFSSTYCKTAKEASIAILDQIPNGANSGYGWFVDFR